MVSFGRKSAVAEAAPEELEVAPAAPVEVPTTKNLGAFPRANLIPDQIALARRGDALLGVVIGRTFSDGTGWIAQLAVARSARTRGTSAYFAAWLARSALCAWAASSWSCALLTSFAAIR